MQNTFQSFNKALISFLCLFTLGVFIYVTLHSVDLARRWYGGEPPKKKAIIILHGLWATGANFEGLQRRLQAKLPTDIEVIIIPEPETASLSIAQQVERLRDALLARGLGKEHYELILLGHSQGGLRGYQLYQKFRGEFHIKGLITMSTPWGGVPPAAITKEKVNGYLNSTAAYYFLGTVDYFWPSSRKLISEFVDKFFEKFATHGPGVQDLVPNSEFLQELAASLKEENPPLPILAIAGSSAPEDFAEIILTDPTYAAYVKKYLSGLSLSVAKQIMNRTYSVIVTGQPRERHDMAVSVASQRADHMPKHKQFSTYTVLGVVHATPPQVPIPDNGSDASHHGAVNVALKPEDVVYGNPEVLDKIGEFTEFVWKR